MRRTGRRTTGSGWRRCGSSTGWAASSGSGDDAGFIYQMYGIGLIRDGTAPGGGLPSDPDRPAGDGNNAKILGQEERLGRVRAGFAADLIVVNGNPLENLKAAVSRRDRVDDQGRYSVSCADFDETGEGDRVSGKEVRREN